VLCLRDSGSERSPAWPVVTGEPLLFAACDAKQLACRQLKKTPHGVSRVRKSVLSAGLANRQERCKEMLMGLDEGETKNKLFSARSE
jgi:hypothetical protein